MERSTVIVEKKERVAMLIVNNPEERNCLSEQTARELISALEEIRDDDNIRVVITRGVE